MQRCLHEALLYAEGKDAVMYAEAAHVVETLMEDVIDKLDSMHLHGVREEAEPSGTTT